MFVYSATRSTIFIIDSEFLSCTLFLHSLAHEDVYGARAMLLFDNGYRAS